MPGIARTGPNWSLWKKGLVFDLSEGRVQSEMSWGLVLVELVLDWEGSLSFDSNFITEQA